MQLQLSDQHRLVQSSSRLLGCKVQGQLIGDTLALLALAVAEFHGHGVAEGLEFRVQAGRCALGLKLGRRVPRPANAERHAAGHAAGSSEDDAPMAQQQEQPRPQVRSRPVPQARMPSGLNQILQTSDSYGPVRRPPAAGRAVLQRAAAGGAGLRARDSLICQDERVLARRSTRESKT